MLNSNYWISKIFGPSHHWESHEEYQNVKYNLDILLVNIKKSLIIYSASALLHCFLITLTTHVFFVIFRKYARGWHALSSKGCTIISAILFNILPKFLMQNIGAPNNVTFIYLQVFIIFITVLYAPSET